MLIEFGEKKEKNVGGNSLVVQWLGLCAVSAEGLGSIPSWETRIPQSEQHDWKKKNVVGKATYWEQVSLHLVLSFPAASAKREIPELSQQERRQQTSSLGKTELSLTLYFLWRTYSEGTEC